MKGVCHFFGTAHGKNACNCIGRTVKILTARVSLPRSINNQILKDMYKLCKENKVYIEFL